MWYDASTLEQYESQKSKKNVKEDRVRKIWSFHVSKCLFWAHKES